MHLKDLSLEPCCNALSQAGELLSAEHDIDEARHDLLLVEPHIPTVCPPYSPADIDGCVVIGHNPVEDRPGGMEVRDGA
jgi:hypothetical protein